MYITIDKFFEPKTCIFDHIININTDSMNYVMKDNCHRYNDKHMNNLERKYKYIITKKESIKHFS